MSQITEFALHQLGWKSFQQLCHTIAREILGQSVESFLDSNDGGRDGAFTGIWRRQGTESLAGRFVIQCKHTALPRHNLAVSDLAEELDKAERLAQQNRCDVYIVMTNTGTSGKVHEALSDVLVVMAHALDEDVLKALTATNEWEKYLESKRVLEGTHAQIEKFTDYLRNLDKDLNV